MTRRPRLEVAPLEDRVTPVIGAFDVPFAADYDTPVGATNLTGVVEYHNASTTLTATGALLDRGPAVVGSRHVLISASSVSATPTAGNGDYVSFYSRNTDGTLRTIDIPVLFATPAPGFNGSRVAGNDLAVVTLAAVAPGDAADYPAYTSAQAAMSQETNKPYVFAGFGLTGTGTSGQAAADLQRMTVTATGGQFFIVRPDTGARTTALNFNATPAQVQSALAGIGLTTTVTKPAGGPFATSFEINFTPVGGFPPANARRLVFVTNPAQPLAFNGGPGSVAFQTLTNGSNDGEFQRLGINATGGTFTLGLGGATSPALPFNATESQIQTAIEGLLGAGAEVTVRRITAGPAAGQFQVSFDTPVPAAFQGVLAVDASGLAGTAGAYILQNAGRNTLTIGQNEYDSLNGTNGDLVSDFDPDGSDAVVGDGDVGAPGFIDVGGGNVAIATVFSYSSGVNGFGAINNNTRVSQFTTFIRNVTETSGYTLTFDMQFQRAGGDGAADVIRLAQVAGVVQVFVSSGGGAERLVYADLASNIATVRLIGTADAETFIIGAGVTRPVVVDGVSGADTMVGPDAPTSYVFNGGDVGLATSPTDAISFAHVQTIVGGAAGDSFAFTPIGSFSGLIDGGGGGDTLNFANGGSVSVVLTAAGPTVDGAAGTASGSALTGSFQNINNFVGSATGTSDSFAGLSRAGVYTQTGATGTYTDVASGQVVGYTNFKALTGGAEGDTFNVRSTAGAMTITGAGGDDAFNLAADAPNNTGTFAAAGALTLDGGAGSDNVFVAGTAGNDAVTMRLTSTAGDGDFVGLPQSLTFRGLEGAAFDGRGGTNSFTLEDGTNTAYGSAATPTAGIVFRPTGGASAEIGVGSVMRVFVGSIAGGVTINGDNDGSGDRDTLLVLGTSAPGLQSAFGEATFGDGRDTVTITDTAVSIVTAAGPLLSLSIASAAGTPTAATLYVATGNERPTQGDGVTVTPSARVNLIVDAMLPAAAVRPGDRVAIPASATTSAIVNDPTLGPPQVRVTQDADGASVGLIGFETGAPQAAGSGIVAVGSDAGPESTVQVYDRLTGAFRYTLTPFPGFTAGVTVATGDVTGDGVADLVVGAGPGGGPRVGIFDGVDGRQLADFFGYDDEFRGGVNVGVGDIDSDGFADLVLGTGPGGGPRVRVLSGKDLSPLRDAFVYPAGFRGGVNVAVGDVNADGTPDVVTSTGSGGGPQVVVLDGATFGQLASFFVFDPASRDGFFITVGDVNGDGFADIVAGAGFGAPAQVRAFSGQNRAVIADFVVNDPFDPRAVPAFGDVGVRVAVGDVDGDGIGDIITGKGPGSFPVIRTYKVGAVNPQTNALFPTLEEIRRQDVFDAGFGFGVFVASSN